MIRQHSRTRVILAEQKTAQGPSRQKSVNRIIRAEETHRAHKNDSDAGTKSLSYPEDYYCCHRATRDYRDGLNQRYRAAWDRVSHPDDNLTDSNDSRAQQKKPASEPLTTSPS